MEYSLSHGGRKKQNTQFINNNNYLTFLLGDNLKNIKINYNIKGHESLNNSPLSNNKLPLNKNLMRDFKNYMNKFDKLNSNRPSNNISFKILPKNDFPSNIFKNKELRRTKDSFFRNKDYSNISNKEEKKLNRNRSAKNIKSSDINIINKDYKININQNNNQVHINYYLKNVQNSKNNPINNKYYNNQNFNQILNYENNSVKNSQKHSVNYEEGNSRNRQRELLLSLNPIYIASRKKVFNNNSNSNKFNLRKNYFQSKSNSFNIEKNDSIKNKNLLQIVSPQNKKPILKGHKTPIFKIKKNILKTNDLSLRKKVKLSSISTKEYYSKLNNKANSEINFSVNDKDIKNIKNTTENKEIKEFIKGYNAATQPGKDKNFFTKINQDYYIIETNINGLKNFNLFGVLDGHGLYGHLISLFVGRYIINTFLNHDEIKSCYDLDELYFKLKHNNFGIINEIFVNAEKELYNEEFDSNFSGTTCIIVIQLGENLICANSGDSRAILIYNQKELLNLNNNNDKNNTTSKSNKMKDSETNFYQIKNIISPFSSYRNIFKNSLRASASVSSLDIKNLNKFTQRSSQRFSLNKITKIPDNTAKGIFCLSNDLKPTLPLEKQRIIENGGRVEQFIENDGTTNGPYRVWVQDEMYPGLAMSRSIGDFIASSVGVIPNPEIIEYNLNNSSKYMIIASDGIWQFMSNEKVMNIANQYYPKRDPIDMCNELIREANIAWDKEGIPRDDITVVVVYF